MVQLQERILPSSHHRELPGRCCDLLQGLGDGFDASVDPGVRLIGPNCIQVPLPGRMPTLCTCRETIVHIVLQLPVYPQVFHPLAHDPVIFER